MMVSALQASGEKSVLLSSRRGVGLATIGAILLHALLLLAWSDQKGAGADWRSKQGTTRLTIALRQIQPALLSQILTSEAAPSAAILAPVQTLQDLALSQSREKYRKQERTQEKKDSAAKSQIDLPSALPSVAPVLLDQKLEQAMGLNGKNYSCMNEKGEPYTVYIPLVAGINGQLFQPPVNDRIDPCVQG